MYIACNHIFVASTFGFVLAIVAATFYNMAKWLNTFSQEGKSTVIFVSNNLAKFTAFCGDISNKALRSGMCFDI